MAELKLNHIYKVYENGHKAVNDFCIDIKDKEFIVFVGPSGCGKSTTLRMIAGLEKITAGDLFIGDTLVNDMEPKDRDIAMVFQNYALYPHMTVYENMAFGLRNRHVPEAVIKEKVLEAARILDITDYLDRKPKAMSGGQRQRVALGRAIVRDPKVFLLDEPLSNLDAKLRAAMRTEITKLHKKLQTTFIYVTHDQVEAMTMGTRIVVMKLGYVQQIDTPMNLYNKPYNKFVAGFIGTPQMNFFDVTLKREGDKVKVTFPEGSSIALDYEAFAKVHNSYLSGEKPAILGIRPDHINISKKETGLKCRVTAVEHLGNESIIYGELGGEGKGDFTMKDEGKSIIIKDTQDTAVEVDDIINVEIRQEKLHLFDKESEITLIQDIPSYNFAKGEIKGEEVSVLGGKVKLPPAMLEKLQGLTNVGFEIPPHAIVKGSALSLKVAKVEKVEDKHLAHLVFGDRYVFALVDESVKAGDQYKFDIHFDEVKVFDGEKVVVEPLPESECLLGKFIKNDISRTEVEFYYVIADEKIHDSLGNGFKINSVDGNECYKKTYKYVFNREKAVLSAEGEGIKGQVEEVLDYGHVKYAKVKVGDEQVLLIVPEGLELSVSQPVSISLKGEDIEVWEPVNDFRIC